MQFLTRKGANPRIQFGEGGILRDAFRGDSDTERQAGHPPAAAPVSRVNAGMKNMYKPVVGVFLKTDVARMDPKDLTKRGSYLVF